MVEHYQRVPDDRTGLVGQGPAAVPIPPTSTANKLTDLVVSPVGGEIQSRVMF